ncbi:MAG: hypothetical protein AAF533_09955 [Acidobacteriota bacterium]
MSPARAVVRIDHHFRLLGSALGLLVSTTAHAADWSPPDPAELAATAPSVDASAGAEVLEWTHRVQASQRDDEAVLVFDQYRRIKIFTAEEARRRSEVQVVVPDDVIVRRVSGRSIHPDGSIHVLAEADRTRRTVLEQGEDLTLVGHGFTIPSVVPGAVIEYRWQERWNGYLLHGSFLDVQLDLPVRRLEMRVSNLAIPGWDALALPLRARWLDITSEGRSTVFRAENVPAFVDEPHRPADADLQGTVLFHYADPSLGGGEDYWRKVGKRLGLAGKAGTRPGRAITAAAGKALSGLEANADLDARLDALLAHARRLESEELEPWRRMVLLHRLNELSAGSILDEGRADPVERCLVAAALARAAGLDARLALLPDRRDITFSPRRTIEALLPHLGVAVMEGDGVRLLAPGADQRSAALLPWWTEGGQALVGDPKGGRLVDTPTRAAGDSQRRTTARLRLEPDGRVHGEVVTRWTGHLARAWRVESERDADTLRASLESAWEQAFGDGVVPTDLRVTGLDAPSAPLELRLSLSIDDLAQDTGGLTVLSAFPWHLLHLPELGEGPRRHPFAFDHAWEEHDVVELSLPDGWRVSTPPEPVRLRAGSDASFELASETTQAGVRLSRSFSLGGNGRVRFPAKAESPLRRLLAEARDSRDAVLALEPAR